MNLTTYVAGSAVLIIACLWGGWTWQAKKLKGQLATANTTIASLNDAVIEAKGVNEANMATLEQIKADLARQAQVAAKFETLAAKRGAALKATLKRIEDAPATDDGPVAPVLSRELHGLRVPGNGEPPADRHHEDSTGAVPDLAEPTVPGPTAAPGT